MWLTRRPPAMIILFLRGNKSTIEKIRGDTQTYGNESNSYVEHAPIFKALKKIYTQSSFTYFFFFKYVISKNQNYLPKIYMFQWVDNFYFLMFT